MEHVKPAACLVLQVFVWRTGVLQQPEAVWQGSAAELCGSPEAPCHVGALALWSLSR